VWFAATAKCRTTKQITVLKQSKYGGVSTFTAQASFRALWARRLHTAIKHRHSLHTHN
jgi:hypothetical protein